MASALVLDSRFQPWFPFLKSFHDGLWMTCPNKHFLPKTLLVCHRMWKQAKTFPGLLFYQGILYQQQNEAKTGDILEIKVFEPIATRVLPYIECVEALSFFKLLVPILCTFLKNMFCIYCNIVPHLTLTELTKLGVRISFLTYGVKYHDQVWPQNWAFDHDIHSWFGRWEQRLRGVLCYCRTHSIFRLTALN